MMIPVFWLLMGLSLQQISQIKNYQVMDGTLIDVDLNDKILTLVSVEGMLEQLPMNSYARAFNSQKTQIALKSASLHRGAKVRVVINNSNRTIGMLYAIPNLADKRSPNRPVCVPAEPDN